MKIGFIGTGTMGQPMLNNLIKRGFGVVAYDIVPAALDAAVKLGATACSSAAEAAKQGDLVVTVLPSSTERGGCSVRCSRSITLRSAFLPTRSEPIS